MQRKDLMELNFESIEMQNWNIPTEKAHRVDEKNGIICLVIMFNPRVMVIKTSKVAHFLYFLLMTAFECTWRNLLSSFSK